jgi:hypothetical protein
MTISSRGAASATKKSTAYSPRELDFNGREPLEFGLTLPQEQRRSWLARRLEAYRDACITFAAAIIRQRNAAGKDKATVAEAEAQAVIETSGFTKVVPLEVELYGYLFERDYIEVIS